MFFMVLKLILVNNNNPGSTEWKYTFVDPIYYIVVYSGSSIFCLSGCATLVAY